MEKLSTILEIVKDRMELGSMNTFYNALMAAELEDFKGDGPMTVFAPFDPAFDKLPENYMNELLNNPDKTKLKRLLQRHVIADIAVRTKNLNETETKLKSVAGVELVLTNPARRQVIIEFPTLHTSDKAAAVMPEILASNGVIYIVDTVLNSEEL